MISLIAAITEDYIIGDKKNTIPWYLPADFEWFRKQTINKPVLMGRVTWESIGYPLPKRKNIVLSNKIYNIKNKNNEVTWFSSIKEAIDFCKNYEEIMVIGGACIYKQLLPKADKLYITHINFNKKIKDGIYFPAYNTNEWKSIFTEFHNADIKNPYKYCFEILERSKNNKTFN